LPNFFALATIHFFSEHQNFTLKQKKRIRQWIISCIQQEKKTPGEINYIFCNDKYLLAINKSFLNHNTLTDIITFPVDAMEDITAIKSITKKINGEIYISIERVKENAKAYGTTFHIELCRVLIHGVLHLCGYGDKTPAQAKKMRAKEDYYLAWLN
jgi:probable rRNA maturation factor